MEDAAIHLGSLTTAPSLVSAAEYMKLPEVKFGVELIDGVVLPHERGTSAHSAAFTALSNRFLIEEKTYGLGEWMLPIDLYMSPYSIFAPDLLYFETEHLPARDEVPVTSVPSIVVEIIAEPTRYRDTIRKRSAYAERGVSEYWIVDPVQKWMLINIRNEDGLYTAVSLDRGIVPVGLFAGSILPIREMFEDANLRIWPE